MIDYVLSPLAMVKTVGSSKGSQPKFLDRGYWYKKNFKGYEGKAEYLISKILDCSNLKNYVSYEECTINGANGCRSKDFTNDGEIFLSFEKMHMQNLGTSLSETISSYSLPEERIQYTLEFVEEYTGFDMSEYFGNILMLDALTLNSDRHTNNIGIIININTGEFREAPIFDNGDSLMSNFNLFPPDKDYEENLANYISYPFSTNPMEQVRHLPVTLKLDYKNIEELILSETPCRALDVLKRQLGIYSSIIPEIKD